jgi:hypothetical protein
MRRRASAVCLIAGWSVLFPVLSANRALAIQAVALEIRVVDSRTAIALADATIVLRSIGADGLPGPVRYAATDRTGEHRFEDLRRGRFRVMVERVGYRSASIEVELARDEPLVISLLIEPVPFRLATMMPDGTFRGPKLTDGVDPAAVASEWSRAAAIRARQSMLTVPDARQLSYADLREANTLAEDDVLRALQSLPGVGIRDDYLSDLWTRGAPSGQTRVIFDGVPLIGSRHVLGILGGLNSDMLSTVTFTPGVSAAAHQGAGAAVVAVESWSGFDGGPTLAGSVSPVSARASATGRVGDRFGWAVGARRSHVDVSSVLARGLVNTESMPYAFGDVTARFDARVSTTARVTGSLFWQRDRVFGDVPDVAYGNTGDWGALAARVSFRSPLGSLVTRHTIGLSRFDAAVRVSSRSATGHAPLHPATQNRFRTAFLESRVERFSGSASWSAGIRTTREVHEYNGPDIDLARLLSPDELARRGIPDLTPIIMDLERARLLRTDGLSRVALWGEGRVPLLARTEVDGGLRLETGDRVAGSFVRFAPRLRVRYSDPWQRYHVVLGYGRSWQYVQTIARTEVVRPGLHASEVLALADHDTPALHSDIITAGAEVWSSERWLLGVSGWLRRTSDVLLPDPVPGVIDEPRGAVPARATARGIELSVRRVAGRIRGFANYTLSRSRYRTASRAFDASEDRRHMANIGVTTELWRGLTLGATARTLSGAPYTGITLIDADCDPRLDCTGRPPVLIGTPGGQRAPMYATLDLMAEWTQQVGAGTLSIYGQVRNLSGRKNRITYHSSCLCVGGGVAGDAGLTDRFDRGLPRLPIIGLRARF